MGEEIGRREALKLSGASLATAVTTAGCMGVVSESDQSAERFSDSIYSTNSSFATVTFLLAQEEGIYDEHDIDPRWDIEDSDRCIRLMEHMWAMEHSLVSTDPVRIRVTAPCDGDELELLLDEELAVVDVGRAS
jgi:hypothetical protein